MVVGVYENVEFDLLGAELAGRPRAVWMKTGYLADVGERPDLGHVLARAAPLGGSGSLCARMAGTPSTLFWCGIARCGCQSTRSLIMSCRYGGARSLVSSSSSRPRHGSSTEPPHFRGLQHVTSPR